MCVSLVGLLRCEGGVVCLGLFSAHPGLLGRNSNNQRRRLTSRLVQDRWIASFCRDSGVCFPLSLSFFFLNVREHLDGLECGALSHESPVTSRCTADVRCPPGIGAMWERSNFARWSSLQTPQPFTHPSQTL